MAGPLRERSTAAPRRLCGRFKVGREGHGTPLGKDFCVRCVLGFDRGHRVAAKRQPHRRIFGISERDQDLCQPVGIARLVMADLLRLAANEAGRLGIVLDLDRADAE
ncbi:hypothetical protein D9M72_611030 [compost metagenome]